MIELKYILLDGCSWWRSDEQIKIFNNEEEINEFLQSCYKSMYDVQIINKKLLKSEE